MRVTTMRGGLMAAMILPIGAAIMILFGAALGADAQTQPNDEVTKAQFDTWMTELSN